MPKRTMATHSRPALQAITLLGHLIKARRIETKLKAEQLAERVGISRALLYRIESGDPSCSIGAVLEAATIVGIRLFDDGTEMATHLARAQRELTLLPRAVRASRAPVHDDF